MTRAIQIAALSVMPLLKPGLDELAQFNQVPTLFDRSSWHDDSMLTLPQSERRLQEGQRQDTHRELSSQHDQKQREICELATASVRLTIMQIGELFGLDASFIGKMPSVYVADSYTGREWYQTFMLDAPLIPHIYYPLAPESAFLPYGMRFFRLPNGPVVILGANDVNPEAIIEESCHYLTHFYGTAPDQRDVLFDLYHEDACELQAHSAKCRNYGPDVPLVFPFRDPSRTTRLTGIAHAIGDEAMARFGTIKMLASITGQEFRHTTLTEGDNLALVPGETAENKLFECFMESGLERAVNMFIAMREQDTQSPTMKRHLLGLMSLAPQAGLEHIIGYRLGALLCETASTFNGIRETAAIWFNYNDPEIRLEALRDIAHGTGAKRDLP